MHAPNTENHLGTATNLRISRRDALRLTAAGSAGIASSGFLAAGASAAQSTPESAVSGIEGESALSLDEAISQLEPFVESMLAETGLPGLALGIVQGKSYSYLAGFGVRSTESPDAVDPDTVFQIASVSKPVASTVIAGVVGDGLVRFDDRLADLDPNFAMSDPWITANVTVRDMLCHRSGLPDHAGDLLEDLGYGRAEVLHRLRYLEPAGAFRSTYAYTNFGLTAAAEAVAKYLGVSWEDLSVERLYGPLEMHNTSSCFSDFESAENRALTHVQENGAWIPKFVRQPDAQSPAGGVSSTVSDLSKWIRLHLRHGEVDERQVIAAEALSQTHLPHIVSSRPEDPSSQRAGFYGLGWNVSYPQEGSSRLSHSGGFVYGAATAVFLVPEAELGIVVLTNGAPIGLAESVSLTFLDLALVGAVRVDYLSIIGPILESQLLPKYGDSVSDGPSGEGMPLDASSYTGTFDNKYFGPLEVDMVEDVLVMRLGNGPIEFQLDHFDRDVFAYQPIGENASGPSAVMFTIGADGLASAVVVENLNIHGAGTFVRRADAASEE